MNLNKAPFNNKKMKNNQPPTPYISSIKSESEILSIINFLFEEEIKENICDILNLPRIDFLDHINKNIRVSLGYIFSEEIRENEKFNNIYSKSQKLFEKQYDSHVSKLTQAWEKFNSDKNDNSNLEYIQNYRKHCIGSSQYMEHLCNKDRIGKFICVYDNTKGNNIDLYMICTNCRKAYFSSNVITYCKGCNINYISSILTEKEDPLFLISSWKNYHCEQILNDKMHCIKCNSYFYLDMKKGVLTCLNKKCLFTSKPEAIIWCCNFCKENFKSEAIVYNPIESDIIKEKVKESLLCPHPFFPTHIPCRHISSAFTHKNSCKGKILIVHKIRNKTILVCSACRALNLAQRFIWTCPECGVRFRDKKKIDKDNIIKDESILRKSSPFLKKLPALNARNSEEIAYLKSENDIYKEKDGAVDNKLDKKKKYIFDKLINDNIIYKMKSTGNINYINSKENNNIYSTSSNKENKDNNNNNNNKECSEKASTEASRKNETRTRTKKKCFQGEDIEKICIKLPTCEETGLSPEDVKEYKNDNIEDIPITDEDIIKDKSFYSQIQRKIKRILNKRKLPLFDIENFNTVKEIGEGSYGFIFEVTSKKTGKRYAMKKIVAGDIDELESFSREFEIVYRNYHECILNIYAICIRVFDRRNYCLFVLMELAEKDWDMEIKERLKEKRYYTEDELLDIMAMLNAALLFLQKEKNIAHRDIKPENILVFKNNLYKIADFGEAKESKISKQLNTLRGTELYMSPLLYGGLKDEVDDVKHNPYKSDMFSLGYCFIYAATLNFNVIHEIRNADNMRKIKIILKKNLGKYYSEEFVDLIGKMINYEEDKRIDFQQLDNIMVEQFGFQ